MYYNFASFSTWQLRVAARNPAWVYLKLHMGATGAIGVNMHGEFVQVIMTHHIGLLESIGALDCLVAG